MTVPFSVQGDFLSLECPHPHPLTENLSYQKELGIIWGVPPSNFYRTANIICDWSPNIMYVTPLF